MNNNLVLTSCSKYVGTGVIRSPGYTTRNDPAGHEERNDDREAESEYEDEKEMMAESEYEDE